MGPQGDRYDVAVVGAGAAGIAAAISCARHGASVCLIDAAPRLGGAATNACVGTICGLALCGESLSTPLEIANPGFATEFASRVAQRSGTSLVRNDRGLSYLPYVPSELEAAAADLVAEHPDITTLLSCSLVSAARSASGEFSLRVKEHSGKHVDEARLIESRCCIDCSGDSVVSLLLSLPTIEPELPQAAAQVFSLGGLPAIDESLLGLTIRKALREAALAGALPDDASHVSLVPGSLRNGTVLCKLGLHAPAGSSESATEAAPRLISLLTEHLRSCVPGLSSLQLLSLAPAVGIRSSRRGLGDEVLSEQAIAGSARSPTGVALGFWPMELWSSPVRPTITFSKHAEPFEIPLGALCSARVPGLYFAGRCISATDHAIASARVIGTCLSTGFAAGRAAVGHLRGESTAAVIEEIRRAQVTPFWSKASAQGARRRETEDDSATRTNRRDTAALS